ncbi:hypothetical protein AgCh_013119 [Apium graveolens]
MWINRRKPMPKSQLGKGYELGFSQNEKSARCSEEQFIEENSPGAFNQRLLAAEGSDFLRNSISLHSSSEQVSLTSSSWIALEFENHSVADLTFEAEVLKNPDTNSEGRLGASTMKHIPDVIADMDTSNPAAFVNGELLRMYVGRRVRTVIQVLRTDGGGVVGKSCDDQQITVSGQLPAPLTTFVEITGIAQGPQSIQSDNGTNFGDQFDLSNFNQLCKLANGEYKHLFI